MGKWIKRIAGILVALGIVAALVVASMPKPLEVDLHRVRRAPMRVTVDEDGRSRVKDRYVISAPLGGNLARIELRPGDEVEAGEVVARIVPIDPPLLDARSQAEAEARVRAATAARNQTASSVERGQAALEFARREVQRLRGLTLRGAVEARALELAELDLRTRTADLESSQFATRVAGWELQIARSALGHLQAPRRGRERDEPGEQMEIGSPVRGRVLRVIAESEGVVVAGAPLLEVGDPSALEIVVDVLTSDAVKVLPGARVEVDGWGGDHTLAARVREIEPSAFTRTSALGVEEQRVNVLVDLTEPPRTWRALGDGYRVEAHIVIWEEDGVLQIPSSALFRQGDDWAVWAVAGQTARSRRVHIGRQGGLVTQVVSGLREGDVVIEHPSDAVDQGVKVRARH